MSLQGIGRALVWIGLRRAVSASALDVQIFAQSIDGPSAQFCRLLRGRRGSETIQTAPRRFEWTARRAQKAC